jgi:hypothetical protein
MKITTKGRLQGNAFQATFLAYFWVQFQGPVSEPNPATKNVTSAVLRCVLPNHVITPRKEAANKNTPSQNWAPKWAPKKGPKIAPKNGSPKIVPY